MRERERERERERQTDRQTDRQTERQRERERETDRQTDRERERERERFAAFVFRRSLIRRVTFEECVCVLVSVCRGTGIAQWLERRTRD